MFWGGKKGIGNLVMSLFKKTAPLIVVSLVIIFLLITFFKTNKEKEMEGRSISVRRPAVAGRFYPGEKTVLGEKIKTFLNEVRPHSREEGFLKVLIVPHAGYDYSGQVAAYGFKQLEDKDFSTVILLGPTHRAYFQGAVIDGNDVWETPLGQVKIDKDLAKEIVNGVQGVSFSSSAHAQEHSLEVEIPFLQSVLDDFKIVPILLGEADESFLENLADVLSKNITPDRLVVISTDLSHYPSYQDANNIDQATIDAILTGGLNKFSATITEQMQKGYPGLDTCVCGEKAVKVGMMLAQKLGEGKWEVIKYANSGDVNIGDKNRVVGYAAIGFWITSDGDRLERSESHDSSEVEEFTKTQQEKLLEIAREALENYLKDKKIPDFEIKDEELEQKLGAFVTLRKDGQLRGCIGQIEPSADPLWQVVRRMAIEAATKDIRFPAVKAEELEDIEIEISVLTKPEKISDPNKIELGKHGVIIRKGQQGGVFLPQVAQENNWDLNTFMGELCSQKAGLPWDCWRKGGVDIYTFTAQVFEEE